MTAEEFKAFSQNLVESINSPEDDRRKVRGKTICKAEKKNKKKPYQILLKEKNVECSFSKKVNSSN